MKNRVKEEDLLKDFEKIQKLLEELQKEYLDIKDSRDVSNYPWGYPVTGRPIFIYEIHSST